MRANAQCESLHFSEIATVPAQCRTASYQSGHGFIRVAAAGGTPDYTYTVINLETGIALTSNAILQSLNPGDYYVKVVDDIGCLIDTFIKLDSVSPQANFDIISVGQFLCCFFESLPHRPIINIEQDFKRYTVCCRQGRKLSQIFKIIICCLF